MNILDGLNEVQQSALLETEGAILVSAGAGSGKTRLLTHRIAYLIKQLGVKDHEIIAITFTNKAAKEMKERIDNLVGYQNSIWVSTFHSMCAKILRENIHHLDGFTSSFTIYNDTDSEKALKEVLKTLGLEDDHKKFAFHISNCKNKNIDVYTYANYPGQVNGEDIIKVYEAYQQKLKQCNALDFDDLLALPVKLFIENPDILEKYQERFKYILIDEYQDTNEVQYKLCKMLARKYQNIFIVGDPDQSIYMFRGANYRNILNFEKDYKNAHVIPLEENYRSTEYILDAANSVIKHNKERKDKNLWSSNGKGVKTKYLRAYDDKHELTLVIDEVKKLLNEGFDKKSIGILYRTNAQARLVEEQFIKASIPYKVVGSYYFYARKEIKDLICYLKLILNNNDEISLRRVINVPKRGIGDSTIKKLEETAIDCGISMFEAISKGKELEFKELIREMTMESENLSLTELIDLILDKSGMKREYENDKTLESELRLDNLMEFKSITASFEEKTGSVNLADFLEEVSLIADMSEHKEEDDVVTLMTIHAAKGLEFDVVFLIGMEEGIFPHQNSFLEEDGLEEERRLCYVGITRARKRLYISNAKRRMLYGKDTSNPQSRFISEIDTELLDIQNERMLDQEKIKKEEMYSSNPTDFNKGDIVMHMIYGRGVIVDIVGDFISVAFAKNYGIKKLMKNHKSIRKV